MSPCELEVVPGLPQGEGGAAKMLALSGFEEQPLHSRNPQSPTLLSIVLNGG